MKHFAWALALPVVLIILSGCAPGTLPSLGAETATLAPTSTVVEMATPTALPAQASTGTAVAEGQTPEGDWFRGDPNAPVTFVEFSDYQCPFCSRHVAQTAPSIDDAYIKTGRIKHVFKDFPLTNIHPQAAKAAEAAHCAGDQNKYWAMHDKLFAQQQDWSGKTEAPEIFKRFASEIGLDAATFSTCLDSSKYAAKVSSGLQQGQALGVDGTPAFFINDWPVSGAQPFAVFQQAIAKAEAGQKPAPTSTPLPAGTDPFTPDPANPGKTLGGNYVKGNADAPVLMVEFSDFQCPYCLQYFTETEPQILKEWVDAGKLRIVFEHFPLSIHPQAPKASEASECAGAQGKFWQMHDLLFKNQRAWSNQANAPELFKEYAKQLELDSVAFDKCLDDGAMSARVQAGLDLGRQAQVSGTPTFFLIKDSNGTRIPGAVSYAQFKEALEKVLAGPQPTTVPATPENSTPTN